MQANWDAYQAKQRDDQRAYVQAEAMYMHKVQAVHDNAASLLDQCRTFAARDAVLAEHMADNVVAAYGEASRRFPVLQQQPLQVEAHGFGEVQDRFADIRLQIGSAGFKNATMYAKEGAAFLVQDSNGFSSLQQKCHMCTSSGRNTATCVVLDSTTLEVVIAIPSGVTLTDVGRYVIGQTSSVRPTDTD